MSLYQVNKLLRDVNCNAELAQRCSTEPEAVVQHYELTPEEREALKDWQVRKLYDMGANPFLLLVYGHRQEYACLCSGHKPTELTKEGVVMAEVVAGVATSHVPFLVMHLGFELSEEGQRTRVVTGLGEARHVLEQARPDAIVIFSTDHFDRCFYDNLPPFLVGIGEEAEGPVTNLSRMPKVKLKVASDLGRFIVSEGLENGVDFALSQDLPLDHAEVVPLSFLTPRWEVPIVPIVVNAFAPPMPSLKRCWRVGAFIRETVERWPEKKRIAVIGTGGLSHWVGPPETGRVNAEFDRWFLQCLVEGREAEVIAQYKKAEELEKVAGNGGQEIRDWLAVAGAMPTSLKPRVLAYEPISQWVTGTGVMAWAGN